MFGIEEGAEKRPEKRSRTRVAVIVVIVLIALAALLAMNLNRADPAPTQVPTATQSGS